ncbi:DUF6207 family protein [Streptomyces lunaelactis]|uniref:DUF6207 family protein n=1 Tax=Streptomyces lunaelactis TaxID=1535768 RepID=UPI00359FB6F8
MPDITAADEPNALAAMTEPDRVWASSGTHRLLRVPGQPRGDRPAWDGIRSTYGRRYETPANADGRQ